MKKTSLLFAAAFLTLASYATSNEMAVKVRSFACDSKDGIETSGVPVTFRGKNYILTSQWGVLEENANVCHEVTSDSLTAATVATLAYFDWASGTALLETKQDFGSAFDLDNASPATPSNNDRKIYGYAKGRAAHTEVQSRVIASKSTRHHFPALQTVNELASEKIDSGLVGAPLYNAGLQGIVSGLWIELVPGSKARVNEWKTKGTEQARQLIALPIGLLQARFKTLTDSRTTFQPMASKLGDRREFYTRDIFWKLNCPDLTGEPPNVIGPIGGPDGVGIGGTMKGTETCNLEITPQNKSPLSKLDFLKDELLNDITGFTIKNGKFSIPYLYDRDAGNHIARMPFLTFPHFFKELAIGTRLPVLVIPQAPSAGSSEPYEQMRTENLKFRKLLTDTYDKIKNLEDERMEFRKLYALSLLLDSIYWKKVTRLDLMSHDLNKDNFAIGIEHEGKLLRKVLLSQLTIVEKLHFDSGGN